MERDISGFIHLWSEEWYEDTLTMHPDDWAALAGGASGILYDDHLYLAHARFLTCADGEEDFANLQHAAYGLLRTDKSLGREDWLFLFGTGEVDERGRVIIDVVRDEEEGIEKFSALISGRCTRQRPR